MRFTLTNLNKAEIMLPTPALVKSYIAAGLDCTHLEVEGDGQHFTAVIVSPAFAGNLSGRRVLFDTLAAAFLAGGVARQSVFLYD